jgi:hypothetical protein
VIPREFSQLSKVYACAGRLSSASTARQRRTAVQSVRNAASVIHDTQYNNLATLYPPHHPSPPSTHGSRVLTADTAPPLPLPPITPLHSAPSPLTHPTSASAPHT